MTCSSQRRCLRISTRKHALISSTPENDPCSARNPTEIVKAGRGHLTVIDLGGLAGQQTRSEQFATVLPQEMRALA